MGKNLLILDFGSQYTQLIARRVRELNVYCEIHPYNKIPNNFSYNGVILSGSPCSVTQNDAPVPNLNSLIKNIPILGICYGAQFLANHFGGIVESSKTREYGRANLSFIDSENFLFENVQSNSQVWMSHGDTIKDLAKNMAKLASTNDVENAAFKINNENIFGIQFHPEVFHSTDGLQIIKNFVVNISKCSTNWTPDSFVETSIKNIKNLIGKEKVVLGISGGVDSSVAALLLHRAIGENLHCIFVDNGLLRKNEFNEVLKQYESLGLNIKGVNAKKEFYNSLKGLSDPEEKRKAIGKTFIDIFDLEANAIKNVDWLAQGTIYPDIIESVSVNGPSVTIKSHHNVGGLPDYMKLKRMIDELNPSEDKEENLLVQQKLTLLYSVLKGRKYTKELYL